MLIGALALAACGDDGSPDAESASPTTTPSPSATATGGAAPSPTSAAPPATATPAAPAGESITIAAVGDISLAREVVPRMEAQGAGYPYALITDLLAADLTIGNLEGALTERGAPWPKGYNFRTPPRFASGLAAAGFDLVSLANNHTMDYGAEGLEDTQAALDQAGVRYAGAGPDAAGAQAALVLEARGLRVAFIACALTPTEGGGFAIAQWAATADGPGLLVCDTAHLPGLVQGARAGADFVVVIVHAGDEYRTEPNAVQRAIAETVLSAGADAYIGHHAHVVQPVEQRGGRLIAWGLGNFIFDLDEVDLANIPPPRVSLVLRLTLTKGAGVTDWEALPVVLEDAQDRPRPATADEAAILQRLLAP